MLYPLYFAAGAQAALADPLSPYIGPWPANFIVGWLLFLSPNVFGFLGWEMQENWRLYRANRARNLEPLGVGAHGETIRGLLQPGFHSGTVPLTYARLRVAERQASHTRNWNKVRVYRHEVDHLGEALARFVDRELTALVRQSRAWQDVKLETGHVYLATNRVRFEIRHPGHLGRAVQIEIQHHHGWLVAGLRDAGWLDSLEPEQLEVFIACLAGFYKRADVDMVREQLLHTLPAPAAQLEFTSDALLARRDLHSEATVFPLRDALGFPQVFGRLHGMVFARNPLPWDDWVKFWEADRDGEARPPLPGVGGWLVNRSTSASHHVSHLDPRVAEQNPLAGLPFSQPVPEGQQG